MTYLMIIMIGFLLFENPYEMKRSTRNEGGNIFVDCTTFHSTIKNYVLAPPPLPHNITVYIHLPLLMRSATAPNGHVVAHECKHRE